MKRRGILIALTGYATSGKDEFADCLVREHGYVKVGWADALYRLALEINPLILCGWWPRHLQDIVDDKGWTDAKKTPGVRKFLQHLGMSVRNNLGEDAWVNAILPVVRAHLRAGTDVAITNTRFKNEAAAVLELDGTLVKITRPGVGPVNEHVSDSGECFPLALAEVENNSTIEDLAEKATIIHDTLLSERTDDRTIPVHAEMYVTRLNQTAARAISLCVRNILSIAAPEDADISQYVKRHRVAVIDSDEGTTQVAVDGELAGEIFYEDGIVTMDAFIAR